MLAAQISEARTVSDSLRLESGRVSAPPGCALDRPKCRAVSRAAWATVVKPGCALDRLRAVSRAANHGLIFYLPMARSLLYRLRLHYALAEVYTAHSFTMFAPFLLTRIFHVRFVNDLKFKFYYGFQINF